MATRAINYTTGNTLKTVLRDFSTGAERLWNTGTNAFEAYSAANIASYGIATPEATGSAGSPGQYEWTVPAALPASPVGAEYQATTYQCAGASLAAGDLPNAIWLGTFAWTGARVLDLRQAGAKESFAVSGAVYHVAAGGNDANDGLTWSTAFATPTHAAAVAVAGDLILLGGMFDLGPTGQFAPAAGVNVRGFGPSTGITGQVSGNGISGAGGLCLITGTGEWEDFSILGNVADGSFQFPLCPLPGCNAVVRRLNIVGQTDGIYFFSAPNTTLRAYDCSITTTYDCCVVIGGTGVTVELHRCTMASNGPAAGQNIPAGNTTGLHSKTAGTNIYVFGGSLVATGNSLQVAVSASAGNIWLVGTTIVTYGLGNPILDLQQSGTGAIYAAGARYDPAKVSGTVKLIETVGGGGFDGPSPLTVNFTGAGGSPVGNVVLNVANVGTARTGGSGSIVIGLNDGQYTINAGPAGGMLFPSTAVTVAGATSVTIVGTAAVIPSPPSANQVVAVMWTRDAHGSLLGNVPITLQLQDAGAVTDQWTQAPLTVTSDNTGLWQTVLERGATYTFTTAQGVPVTVSVPAGAASPWTVTPEILGA